MTTVQNSKKSSSVMLRKMTDEETLAATTTTSFSSSSESESEGLSDRLKFATPHTSSSSSSSSSTLSTTTQNTTTVEEQQTNTPAAGGSGAAAAHPVSTKIPQPPSHHQRSVSASTMTAPPSLPPYDHHKRSVSFYEELKIRDGPLYAINAPKRNVSSEYLIGLEAAEAAEADDPSRTSSHSNTVHNVNNRSVDDESAVDDSHHIGNGNGNGNGGGFILASNTHLQNNKTNTNNMGTFQDHTNMTSTSFCSVASSSCDGCTTTFVEEPTYTRNPLPAEKTALLIVDVQPEYWSNCPQVRKDFPHFPDRLAKTIEICRRRKAKIIWVRADYRYSHSPWLLQFERIRGPRNLGEVPCDPSSPSFTSWEDFAHPQGGEVIIAKSSWSSTTNTALMDILKSAGVENVLVCGLITSVCVQHSAFGVFEAGYRTSLVTDACADRGRARHEAAIALYGEYMYELVTSDDLECEKSGLVPAQPVWLTLDSKTRMVRANSFPKQDERTTTTVMGSNGKTTTTVIRPPPLPSHVHYHPHGDADDGVDGEDNSDTENTENKDNCVFGMKAMANALKHSESTNSTTTTVCSSSTSGMESPSSNSSAGSNSSSTSNGLLDDAAKTCGIMI